MPKRSAKSTNQRGEAEIVDPGWLIRAVGFSVAGAAICGYLAVCLLVYLGGWQLMLHPAKAVERKPSVAFEQVRFDAGETGTPRLAGWWIPADRGAFAGPARTILFLHGGSGSLAASVPELEALHRAEVNVFAFDYQGFGESAGPHPSESRMLEDAAAALEYLENTRHLPGAKIVPMGEGLGAVLAVRLAQRATELPAVVVDAPDPGAFARAAGNSRAQLLPMRWLLQDRFDIAAGMAELKRPKLLLANSPFGTATDQLQANQAQANQVQANQALFRRAADPKMIVTYAADTPTVSTTALGASLRRFLDEYVPE